tara:strand:+ start:1133 stop:1561 length:429 start_codon:yes stop_codon:yes gene_type:complete
MEEQEIREKLNQLEALNGNVFCNTCSTYVKKHVVCSSKVDFDKCPRLRPPKVYKDTCPYCGKKFESHLSLGGHMVTCKQNPKSKHRNNKIADSHSGLVQSDECKNKISESMKAYHQSVNADEEDEIDKQIIVDDKKIDITFY